MKSKKDFDLHEFFVELTEYENRGVGMYLEGAPASPMQIINAHVVHENVSYMRDYIMDENGAIKELGFDKVSNKDDVNTPQI